MVDGVIHRISRSPEMWGKGEAERLWCYRVEVRETQANMAFREGHREWNEDLFE